MNKLYKLICNSITISIALTFAAANLSATEKDSDPEMEELIVQVCDHVVMCMKQELEENEEEMSPRMLSMIDAMAKNTCQSMREYSSFVEYSSVTKDDVKACYKAMANVECGKLEDQEDIPACKVISDKLEQM